ncbi:MAG: prepilin-type N-terminal cleavage/methylation domain-containing protein, partial [Candidatus Moranbacteria bacterium]|nr:prepilin-type N-terminal cleavage/methylation domain-containing protein [Candidatus Moranbacteria bacterium]
KEAMQKTSKTLKAFTLIEILIVIAIIMIMSAVILTNYSSSRSAEQLESAAREVEAAVREAQSYALTGYQGVVGTDPCRFEVRWSGSAYSVWYWYKNASDVCDQRLVLGSYAVRNGVTFNSGSNFYYTPPYATGSFSGTSLAIVLRQSSTYHTVCVYARGIVNNRVGQTCP